MNGNDLFDIIGHTSDHYILDAVYIQKSDPKALSSKWILLIAAIAALILCLVGCTIVYALSLQDMKVREHNFYIPSAYDEEGNLIPIETHAQITQLSLQGSNIDVLSEWLAFTNTYDHDLANAVQADEAMKAGRTWNIPENYNIIDMTINLDAGYLKLENAYGSYRYSMKEFFCTDHRSDTRCYQQRHGLYTMELYPERWANSSSGAK